METAAPYLASSWFLLCQTSAFGVGETNCSHGSDTKDDATDTKYVMPINNSHRK